MYVIERIVNIHRSRTKLTAEMRSFTNSDGSFGRTTTIQNRDAMFPGKFS